MAMEDSSGEAHLSVSNNQLGKWAVQVEETFYLSKEKPYYDCINGGRVHVRWKSRVVEVNIGRELVTFEKGLELFVPPQYRVGIIPPEQSS